MADFVIPEAVRLWPMACKGHESGEVVGGFCRVPDGQRWFCQGGCNNDPRLKMALDEQEPGA